MRLRFGQGLDREFRRAVVAGLGERDGPAERRHVEDVAAAPLPHAGKNPLHQCVEAEHVGLELRAARYP